MRTLSCLAVVALAPVLVLCAEQRAAAYFPLNCNRAHAKNDFKDAALVVIGRVTAVERFRDVSPPASKAGKKEPTYFFYLATVTVGRTLKGKAKPGGWFVQLRDEVGHLKSEPAPLGGAFFYPDPEHKWDGSSLPR